MDRREFIKTTGAAAAVMAAPLAAPAQTMPPAGDDIEKRARDLLGQMTLDEKITMMAADLTRWTLEDNSNPYRTNNTPGCPRLGIPGIHFADGSRGIRFTGATCFPAAMARGASWDPELEERVGKVIGWEGRAGGANFFAGVVVNLLRHPSWGRSQETFGEDPYHLGRMGSAVLTGAQNHVMACTKHFAANSIDLNRHVVDVEMDERTLREIYLPHFHTCVKAGTASIMNAYNGVNGETCSANSHLLRDILKDEWGFRGFVLSDFGSVKSTIPAANGGCDVEMPRRLHYDWKLKLAVMAGLVPMENIDDAVLRQLRQHLRFIHLENSPDYDKAKIGGPEHAAVARESAVKSMVLLKNDGPVLPLDRASLKTIAVIGELADVVNLGATGSTAFEPAYVVKPLDGIKRAAGEALTVNYVKGDDLTEVDRAAREADAVIVVVGLTHKDENEGFDRLRLTLRDYHEELIRAAAVNPKCVVVVQAGGAVIMEQWKNDVPAILMSWYSGMEGGNALADLIFGDANPSGKLSITFPKSPDQLPPFDNKALTVHYGYYHGYRLFEKQGLEAAFPFGHGLSYTRYDYSNLRLDADSITEDQTLTARVDVTNAGDRAGEEIVQLYVGYEGSAVDRPVKDLRAFARTALAPGETKTITLTVPAHDLAYYDETSQSWKVEKIAYHALVGPSSLQEKLLRARFEIS